MNAVKENMYMVNKYAGEKSSMIFIYLLGFGRWNRSWLMLFRHLSESIIERIKTLP